jgi:hypothetical protein
MRRSHRRGVLMSCSDRVLMDDGFPCGEALRGFLAGGAADDLF